MVSVSIVVFSLAVIICIWGSQRMRISISALLFVLFLFDIKFGLDAAVRDAVRSELAKGDFSTIFLDGVHTLRNELDPLISAIFIICCGFLALGLTRNKE